MNKELLLIELCREVLDEGIETERFNRLWLETGVRLECREFAYVDKLKRLEESVSIQLLPCRRTVH